MSATGYRDESVLLLDETLLEQQRGIRREVQIGRKSGVLMEPDRDQPWEYCGPGMSRRIHLYADSDDGITWVKPPLGIFTFNGDPANNIVWDLHGAAVFIDRNDPDPERRYGAWRGPPGSATGSSPCTRPRPAWSPPRRRPDRPAAAR